jgi:hypothetical protein
MLPVTRGVPQFCPLKGSGSDQSICCFHRGDQWARDTKIPVNQRD